MLFKLKVSLFLTSQVHEIITLQSKLTIVLKVSLHIHMHACALNIMNVKEFLSFSKVVLK